MNNKRTTVRELSQLRALKREIDQDRERLQHLRMKSTSISCNLSGMPRKPGASDKTASYAVEMVALEQLIAANMQRAIRELLRLQTFINDIEDSELRQIFYLRYVKGRSWVSVAASLNLGSEATPRKRHDIYLSSGRSARLRTRP